MSLIFDNFATEQDARDFMTHLHALHPGRACQLFMDRDAAQKHDPFPFRLTPPIVHVDRAPDESVADEAEIEALVDNFTGTFAGT